MFLKEKYLGFLSDEGQIYGSDEDIFSDESHTENVKAR